MGEAIDIAMHYLDGYLHLDREWQTGDVVTLNFPMIVQRIRRPSACRSRRRLCGVAARPARAVC